MRLWHRQDETLNDLFFRCFKVIHDDCVKKCIKNSSQYSIIGNSRIENFFTHNHDEVKGYFDDLFKKMGLKLTAKDAMNIQYNESGMPQNIKVVDTTSDNNSIQKLTKENKLYKKKCEEFKQQVENFADINMKLTEENRELKELVKTYKNIAEQAVSLLDETNTKVQQKMKGKKPKNIYETDNRDNNNLQNKNMNRRINLQINNMKKIENKRNNIISTRSNNNVISTNINNKD